MEISNIDQLNKPEICFELKVRNIEFSQTDTSEILRQKLLTALQTPDTYPTLQISPNNLTTDFEEITKNLKLIEACLTSFSTRKLKIFPYLTHTRMRLNLIDLTADLTSDQLSIYLKLSHDLDTFQTQYDRLIDGPSQSENHSTVAVQDTCILPSQLYFDTLTQKLQNISDNKYNQDFKRFNFKGEGCPKEFITNLEEFALIRNIPEKILFNHIYDILHGTALDWFRSKKEHIKDWKTFKTTLLNDFEVANHDFNIKKIIESRKQKTNERVIIYFSTMESLFNKLHNSLSESDKIDTILRNLLPQYSLRVTQTDLTTLSNLLEACKFTEKLLHVNNNTLYYSNPSTSTSQITSQPYHRTYGQIYHNRNFNQNTQPRPIQPYIPEFPFNNSISAIKTKQSQLPTSFTCPRCRINTHTLHECTNTQRICFRCGKKDYTVLNCPDCNKTLSKN